METLAKQIERGMHGVWKHCMIRDEVLERIWPIHEADREEKIAQFAKKYGFRLSKGNVRHLRQMAAAAAHLNTMWSFLKSKDLGRGKRSIAVCLSSPGPADIRGESSRRQL
jgi:hypothetical protein